MAKTRQEITEDLVFVSGMLIYLQERLDELANYNQFYKRDLKMNAKRLQESIDKPLNVLFEQADGMDVDQANMLADLIEDAMNQTREYYKQKVIDGNKQA
jgi:hypothetical protein